VTRRNAPTRLFEWGRFLSSTVKKASNLYKSQSQSLSQTYSRWKHSGMTETSLLDTMKTAVSALSMVPTDAAIHNTLDDDAALALSALVAEGRRYLDTQAVLAAGVLAKRSAPEMGGLGLAQKMGKRTPEELVKSITGVTGTEAARAVRIGRMAHDAAQDGQLDLDTGEIFVAGDSWMRAVLAAVTTGEISVQTADAIRAGAGLPSSSVTEKMLTEVTGRAVEYALAGGDTDRVLKFTKDLRNQIDAAGVAEREAQRHAERSWKFTMHPDGSATSFIRHDILSAAYVKDIYDRATSPKLPTFVDLADPAGSAEGDGEAVPAAPETSFDAQRQTAQRAHDTIMQIVLAGAKADPSELLGNNGARIHVLVTQEQLDAQQGIAFIDGQSDPISAATVKKMMCEGNVIPVIFDQNGKAIDPGGDKKRRLFSAKQKIILSVMFGGCAFEDCDRPASWCEAHHILWVKRDGGTTVIDNGILLCRHHHLLLHNNGWEIRHTGASGEELCLVPPGDVDPERTPQAIRFKSRAYQQLLAGIREHDTGGPLAA